MTDAIRVFETHFGNMTGTEKISRLTYRDVERNPERYFYALVEEPSTNGRGKSVVRTYRAYWDANDRVVVFKRYSEQLVARITLDSSVPGSLELRKPTVSNKADKPKYVRYWLLSAFSSSSFFGDFFA